LITVIRSMVPELHLFRLGRGQDRPYRAVWLMERFTYRAAAIAEHYRALGRHR